MMAHPPPGDDACRAQGTMVFLAGGRKALIVRVVAVPVLGSLPCSVEPICREYPVTATSWQRSPKPDPDASAVPRRLPTPGNKQVRCSPALALPGCGAGRDAETHPPMCPPNTDSDEDPGG
jgi:hypothetical protein